MSEKVNDLRLIHISREKTCFDFSSSLEAWNNRILGQKLTKHHMTNMGIDYDQSFDHVSLEGWINTMGYQSDDWGAGSTATSSWKICISVSHDSFRLLSLSVPRPTCITIYGMQALRFDCVKRLTLSGDYNDTR